MKNDNCLVFNVNGGVLYINYRIEHLSVQIDDICFSTVALPA